MADIHPESPLAGISRDTARSLVEQVALFIDPVTRGYRSTPPERERGGVDGGSYVSGTDVEEWPGKLARFREKWEARPPEVRDAILRLAHPSDPDNSENEGTAGKTLNH